MKTTESALAPTTLETHSTTLPLIEPSRTVRYIGPVTRAGNERALRAIEKHVADAAHEPITLFVTSTGGPTGSAMSFYDTVRHVVRPNLVTVGSGDVDSSGIIIFCAGKRRYVTARTTLLLHPAGRVFGNQRYTTGEMAAMLAEDRLKDEQYASVLAENSRGRMTAEDVLTLMRNHTVLAPADAVLYGLADGILP